MNESWRTQLSIVLRDVTRRRVVGLVGLMVVAAAMESVGIGAIPVFVGLVSATARPIQASALASLMRLNFLGESPRSQIIASGVGLVGFFITKNGYLAFLSRQQWRFVSEQQIRLGRTVFDRIMHRPFPAHVQRDNAATQNLINYQAMEVAEFFLRPLVALASEALVVTALLGVLFWIEPTMSLVAAVVLGVPTALFLRGVRRRTVAWSTAVQTSRTEMLRAVNDGIGGWKALYLSGRTRFALDTYDRASRRYGEASRSFNTSTELPRLILECVALSGILALTAVAVLQNRPMPSIVPTISLLAAATVRLIPSFNRIAQSIGSLRFGREPLRDVAHELSLPSTFVTSVDLSAKPISMRTGLTVDRASFTYAGAARPAIRDVSLSIPAGSFVGIVGPSGSGKSTLVDLMLGLLPPDRGRVLVDGVDISTVRHSWYRSVGHVPQFPYIADDTIRRNIAFGVDDRNIDNAAIDRVLEVSQLADVVAQLSNGLDTRVGEGGSKLSGGQRQRIAIGRALYNDPEILIMDEATAALDAPTERALLHALRAGGRTVVIVAHRTSTTDACDTLVTLSHGTVGSSSPVAV